MDFHPTEEQAAAAGLAARIFADLATHERLAEAGTGSDAELWKALTTAGLTAAIEEIGLLGLVLLLEEQGRTTAQVPYAATCVYGILPVAAHGSPEQRARLLPALGTGEAVATRPSRRTAGSRPKAAGSPGPPAVPWLRDATHVLVPDADRALWLLRTDAPGVRTSPVETTAPWSAGRLTLTGAEGERLGSEGAYEDTLAAARTAFAGLQAGVCAGSWPARWSTPPPGSSSAGRSPPTRGSCCARPTRTWTPRRSGSPPTRRRGGSTRASRHTSTR